MKRVAYLGVALVALLFIPVAAGHGKERHTPDELLREAGEKLMVGEFRGQQEGPLVVVPYVDGPLTCGMDLPYQIAVTDGFSVTFLHNATQVQASFALTDDTKGYVAFGTDTRQASRALFLMQEYVVAVHRVAATVLGPDRDPLRQGFMGIPHVAGPSGHGFSHRLEGDGIAIEYVDDVDQADACGRPAPSIRLDRDPAAGMEPGRVVHAIVLRDPNLSEYLPRPIDNSTDVFQVNLYLACEGEDPDRVRQALDPKPGAHEWLPLSVLGLAFVGLSLRSVRRRVR